MFEGGFNHISEFILDYSKTIVQADAGIFQPAEMERSRLWHLRRPNRNLQITLPTEAERNVRSNLVATDRFQLRLPLELEREPRHRGHAPVVIPESGGTRNTETHHPDNRSPNVVDSLRGAVSRSDNDRPLCRNVVASNESIPRNNRAARASVDRG